jgi:hypothetical protein
MFNSKESVMFGSKFNFTFFLVLAYGLLLLIMGTNIFWSNYEAIGSISEALGLTSSNHPDKWYVFFNSILFPLISSAVFIYGMLLAYRQSPMGPITFIIGIILLKTGSIYAWMMNINEAAAIKIAHPGLSLGTNAAIVMTIMGIACLYFTIHLYLKNNSPAAIDPQPSNNACIK